MQYVKNYSYFVQKVCGGDRKQDRPQPKKVGDMSPASPGMCSHG